ncbi:putative Phenylacetate--CoA ligase [Paraburkholderia ribeironis]|uniref:Putative Phenylacetate--CoA ligase n=1 Tax=Paraburkholderia ribeironis TaxID=1247936 RepID=A0A1N7RZF9_9BURK|nr:phenylacetate--CoA ligase family protein [Paraburkholderia ribeironis]SIT40529.1 putative Phenylacetate--CoA ligase [Paraburkholderia ribeironis]
MLDRLNAQLERLRRHPFYAGRLPSHVMSTEEFAARTPLMSRADLVAEMGRPGYGAFAPHVPPVRVHLTPMGAALVPILNSAADLRAIEAACGQHLDACGIGPGDVCMVTFGYHLFVAGLFYQSQMEARGVACIPHGPGETERAADIARRCGVTVLAGNPSHALKLIEAGCPVPRVFFAGGEAFTGNQALYQRVHDAMPGTLLIDSFSLSECLPVARTFPGGTGVHVFEELLYAEVIDPDSGQPVAHGERGELVLTHLTKELQPLVRYRTGDLTVLRHTEPVFGRTVSLPRVVFGRADSMLKIKGVKIYPSELRAVLLGVEGLSGAYRLVVSRNAHGGDRLSLQVEGTPAPAAIDAIAMRFKQQTLISADAIEAVVKLEGTHLVTDQRSTA